MGRHTTAGTGESESSDAESNGLTRRRVLRGASTAAAGLVGATAMSGTAAAGGCDYDYPSAPSWFGEVEPENWAFHNWPWDTHDLTIFVHGFTNTNGGRSYAYEVYRNLSAQGYGGHVTACDWNAGDSWDDWWDAKENAVYAGERLADILNYYGWTADHGVDVNLIGHSLGGKTALECVRHLQGHHGHSIKTVNLLGAAVWDEHPTDRFYDGILYGTEYTHNYYSENDGVLANAYQVAEFGRHACGYTGARAGAPWNWIEHDVTHRIHEHCEYMDYDAGVVWYIDDDL